MLREIMLGQIQETKESQEPTWSRVGSEHHKGGSVTVFYKHTPDKSRYTGAILRGIRADGKHR